MPGKMRAACAVFWLSAVTVGGCDPTPTPDADVPMDTPRPDTPAPTDTRMGCTVATLRDDCPPRACERATDCVANACVYTPIVCGIPGRVCPVERCRGTPRADGTFDNSCEVVDGAACGTGGMCVGFECVIDGNGLREERFETGELRATSGVLTIRGSAGISLPGEAPVRSGVYQLTGDFSTTSD